MRIPAYIRIYTHRKYAREMRQIGPAISADYVLESCAHRAWIIARSARILIKLLCPCDKTTEREAKGDKEGGTQSWSDWIIGVKSRVLCARGCSPDLSALPDGDIINVNCPNCTVIARSFAVFYFLSLSSVSYLCSPHFLSSLTTSPTLRLLSFRAPAVSFPLFSSLAECERLHLHLNLAVDLAVVRGHHSCRGKGRL